MPDAPTARALAAAQEDLRRLVAAHAAGEIDADRLAAERGRIEHEIGQWLLEPATRVAAPPASVRPSGRLVGALAISVFAIASAGYAWKGSPALAGLAATPDATMVAVPDTPMAAASAPPDAAASEPGPNSLEQIARMVDQLAARMKERPDDAEGWTMLGRAYTVLGRFAEAAPAYRRAIQLQPSNAALLADYADALIAGNGGHETEESQALIKRALALDPHQPKTLALAGTVAYDRGDYAAAVAHWQKLADGLPPQSEMARQVDASIAEARAKAGGAAAPGSAAAAADKSVSGTVSLAPEIAHLAASGDTVFIFARAASGSRMPLAVKRATVAELPLAFTLDDSMAMTPETRLSGAERLVVGARISKSGNAAPQPGDLAGEASPVAPGASGMAVRIGSVVGKR